jgi:hypothetical protein
LVVYGWYRLGIGHARPVWQVQLGVSDDLGYLICVVSQRQLVGAGLSSPEFADGGTRDVKLISIGNSKGIRIPKALLQKYGWSDSLVLEEEVGVEGWESGFSQRVEASGLSPNPGKETIRPPAAVPEEIERAVPGAAKVYEHARIPVSVLEGFVRPDDGPMSLDIGILHPEVNRLLMGRSSESAPGKLLHGFGGGSDASKIDQFHNHFHRIMHRNRKLLLIDKGVYPVVTAGANHLVHGPIAADSQGELL